MTTTESPAGGSILGNPVPRVEDPRILHGEARYFDDLSPDGCAHVVFVRSTIAHARITGIDTSDAEGMPGVLSVATNASLELAPVQGFVMLPPVFSRPPLADGVVRFVGDIVAAVVAETRAQAVDAAEMVIVDYDPLPTVVDPEAALAALPRPRVEHRDRVQLRRRLRAARRRRGGRTREVRQPADRRSADGAERDPRRAAPRGPARHHGAHAGSVRSS
jgi:xanthine dehydrogenase molybdopterin-binding subunit B